MGSMAVSSGFARVIAGTGPVFAAFPIPHILPMLAATGGAAGHGLAPGHAAACPGRHRLRLLRSRRRPEPASGRVPAAGLTDLRGLCDTRAQRRPVSGSRSASAPAARANTGH
jgi:hypothetical protein